MVVKWGGGLCLGLFLDCCDCLVKHEATFCLEKVGLIRFAGCAGVRIEIAHYGIRAVSRYLMTRFLKF